jgi:hypothetical protein
VGIEPTEPGVRPAQLVLKPFKSGTPVPTLAYLCAFYLPRGVHRWAQLGKGYGTITAQSPERG